MRFLGPFYRFKSTAPKRLLIAVGWFRFAIESGWWVVIAVDSALPVEIYKTSRLYVCMCRAGGV